MQRLVAFLEPLATGFGGFGLFLVTFLDSSFLSLPEVADLAIVFLVIGHPSRWWYYALMSTAGSVLGCYILYYIARKGGEAFIRKRFKEHHVAWGLRAFQKYGVLAIIVPSLMPPPMPFKIFILLAGIADVAPATFLGALIFGRVFRYGGEALLAYLYGPQALDFIQHNLVQASLWLAGGVVVIGIVAILWRRRSGARPA